MKRLNLTKKPCRSMRANQETARLCKQVRLTPLTSPRPMRQPSKTWFQLFSRGLRMLMTMIQRKLRRQRSLRKLLARLLIKRIRMTTLKKTLVLWPRRTSMCQSGLNMPIQPASKRRLRLSLLKYKNSLPIGKIWRRNPKKTWKINRRPQTCLNSRKSSRK